MKTRDINGVYYKFPNRTCKDCFKYPCLDGMNKLLCDLATYGCKHYEASVVEETKEVLEEDATDNITC